MAKVTAAKSLERWGKCHGRDAGEVAGVEWDDPVDRMAVGMLALSYMTVADAHSEMHRAGGRGQLDRTWSATDPPTRQLYRRRAMFAVETFTTKPEGA